MRSAMTALSRLAAMSIKTEMGTWVFDTETLPNRTLFCAKNIETGEWFDLWRHDDDAPARLTRFVQQADSTFIGFNSKSFDNAVVAAFCLGRTEIEIKRIADDIITNRLSPWNAMRKHNLRDVILDDIDLIEVAPSFVGLKAYGARMHMPKLQDMPIAHDEMITPDQEPVLLEYCHNDVDTTAELLNQLEGELMLRVEMSRRYGADMRSKSDSQMAEQAYITSMGLKRQENDIPKTVRYTPPAFLKFMDAELQSLLDRVSKHVFNMNQVTGHVQLPDFLGLKTIKFGSGEYQLGVGGIHSVHDRQVCHIAGDDHMCDIDAASFYPSIILECGFVPAALGKRFVEEYRKIYERRLEAKRNGDKITDATLKISLNGTFGKLASRYSVLYSPDLMLAVTLTGQFTLLMLIEWLERAGALTLSANTDGIAIKYTKEQKDLIEKVVSKFSEVSGFSFEYTPYRALAMKDVNNYIAVKPDRKLKVKGIYAPLSLKKNPTAQVSSDAVGEWLASGTAFETTIRSAPFTHFISARNVTGGGQQNGVYLGKVVRWYQSTDASNEPIKYASNGNKVPKTEGAKACMTLLDKTTHPADLDYDWYNKEAIKIAIAVGCSQYLTSEQIALVAPPPKKTRKAKNGTR
jgi:hypothetical protein